MYNKSRYVYRCCLLIVLSSFFVLLGCRKVYAVGVVINELFIATPYTQWIELFNTHDTSQDISGWIIDDSGGNEKFTIPKDTVLFPKTCLTFQSGLFNWNTNSSDSARLLSGGAVIDEYQFSGSPGENKSFARFPDGTGPFIVHDPSQNFFNDVNQSCVSPSPTVTPTFSPSPKPTSTPTAAKVIHTPTVTPLPLALLTSTSIIGLPTETQLPKNYAPQESVTQIQKDVDEEMGMVLANSDIQQDRKVEKINMQGKASFMIISFFLIGFGFAMLTIAIFLRMRYIKPTKVLEEKKI